MNRASPPVAADNRHAVHEMPMHDLEVGVWCAISERRITGGQHFQRNNKLQTLCEINYVTLLPSTQRNKYSYRNVMRDNATAHSESYVGDSASPPPRTPDSNSRDLSVGHSEKEKCGKIRTVWKSFMKISTMTFSIFPYSSSDVCQETYSHDVKHDYKQRVVISSLCYKIKLVNTERKGGL